MTDQKLDEEIEAIREQLSPFTAELIIAMATTSNGIDLERLRTLRHRIGISATNVD